MTPGLDQGTFRALLLGMGSVAVVLGLLISYIAFREWRPNGSRPVLFVSVGFALVVGVPAVLYLVLLFVPAVTENVTALLTQVSKVAGMGRLLYGIWLRSG